MKFKIGDDVKIICKWSKYYGRCGKLTEIRFHGSSLPADYIVDLGEVEQSLTKGRISNITKLEKALR